MRFLVGGYAADLGGIATGIGVLVVGGSNEGPASGQLTFVGDAVQTLSPSWVAGHPTMSVAYAALESTGAVQAFRRTGETRLEALGDPVQVGELVCHVAVSPGGRFLIASCWGDGHVVRIPLRNARLGRPVVAGAAKDPHSCSEGTAVRTSRAHQALFLPGGLIVTTDLGFDLLRIWRDTRSGLAITQEVTLPVGCGPRHMLWHPSGHLYVVAELSCEVFALAADSAGVWRIVSSTPLAANTHYSDTAAEITMSTDGAFLYAGIRGSNTIATIAVRNAGSSVVPSALVDAGVDWPRYHRVVQDDVLLVAGQRSNEIASLSIDVRSGVPGRVMHRGEAPSPTHILPF